MTTQIEKTIPQNKLTQGRKFKITLNSQDSQYLKEIAESFNISESEVLRKGLQLMALYSQTKEDKSGESALILKKGDSSRELMILV